MPRCADVTLRPLAARAPGAEVGGRDPLQRPLVLLARRASRCRARRASTTPAIPATSAASLPPLQLGVLLRHLGAITEGAAERGARVAARVGPPPRRRAAAPRPRDGRAVLQALAAQSGVSYLPSFDVAARDARARVAAGRHGARARPGAVRGRRGAASGCASSARRRCRARRCARCSKLTGWTAEPYLVDDEVWEQALQPYRPAHADRPAVARR